MSVVGDATWDNSGILARAATRGHVWVHGSEATTVCNHQRSSGCPWSGLLPKDMFLSQGRAEMILLLTWIL